jgi:hypothetical protein
VASLGFGGQRVPLGRGVLLHRADPRLSLSLY